MKEKSHSFLWHFALNILTFLVCFALVVGAFILYLHSLPTFFTPDLLQLYDSVILLLQEYVNLLSNNILN